MVKKQPDRSRPPCRTTERGNGLVGLALLLPTTPHLQTKYDAFTDSSISQINAIPNAVDNSLTQESFPSLSSQVLISHSILNPSLASAIQFRVSSFPISFLTSRRSIANTLILPSTPHVFNLDVSHRLVLVLLLLRQNVSFLALDPRHGSSLALSRDILTIASRQAIVHSEANGLQLSVLQPLDTTRLFEFLQMTRLVDLDFDVLDPPERVEGEFAQFERVGIIYVQLGNGPGVIGNQSGQERVHAVAGLGHGECEGRFREGLQGGFVVDLAADLEEVHRHLAELVDTAPDSLYSTGG